MGDIGEDFKAFKEEIRENRNEAWQKWLPRFKQIFEERMEQMPELGCYRIVIAEPKPDEPHKQAVKEIYDYYPMANKVHIHKNNTWHKPGLKFLIKKFIS